MLKKTFVVDEDFIFRTPFMPCSSFKMKEHVYGFVNEHRVNFSANASVLQLLNNHNNMTVEQYTNKYGIDVFLKNVGIPIRNDVITILLIPETHLHFVTIAICHKDVDRLEAVSGTKVELIYSKRELMLSSKNEDGERNWIQDLFY